MTSRLTIPLAGACAGHPCDNCATCRRGRCCRRDDPGYHLPEEGEWNGPIFGEIGVLDDDGETVGCHCCGRRYRALGAHVRLAHDLTAAEYKAIFGLLRGQGLVAGATHDLMHQKNRDRIARGELDLDRIRQLPTREQLAAFAAGTKMRRQAVKRSEQTMVQAICPVCARAYQRQLGDRRRTCSRACGLIQLGRAVSAYRARVRPPCVVCGGPVPPSAKRRKTCGPACALEAVRAAQASRRRTFVCTVCGASFYHRNRRAACGDPACQREVHRRVVQLAIVAQRDPAVRRKMSESAKRRWARMNDASAGDAA